MKHSQSSSCILILCCFVPSPQSFHLAVHIQQSSVNPGFYLHTWSQTRVQDFCDFFTTLKKKKYLQVKLERLEVHAFKHIGIPTQPGRQKRHHVAKRFEESAGFDMCITALSQLFPKLEKLAMLHKIPLDFRFKRRQVNVLSFLYCKSASHSD